MLASMEACGESRDAKPNSAKHSFNLQMQGPNSFRATRLCDTDNYYEVSGLFVLAFKVSDPRTETASVHTLIQSLNVEHQCA